METIIKPCGSETVLGFQVWGPKAGRRELPGDEASPLQRGPRHRPLSRFLFLALPYRILNISHKKVLLRAYK